MSKSAKESTKNQGSLLAQLVMPLAALVRKDLLGLVHQIGLQAFAAMLEAERTQLCGERYKHNPTRKATRAGSTRGELARDDRGEAQLASPSRRHGGEWLSRSLGEFDIWGVFIDGIHFGEHVMLCALGVDQRFEASSAEKR